MGQALVVIVGPTASGKSALAVRLAEKFNGEIVSADSWLVRRQMDIGTAKPSTQDKLRVVHHLIDIISPKEGFSAALYKKLALASIRDIESRGKVVFLVGGSGLYIDSLLYDYSFLPSAGAETRQLLNTKTLDQLLEIARDRKLSLDEIDTRNKRRIIRLLETNGALATKNDLMLDCLIIGLSPTKEELIINLKKRIDKMINQGLELEVESLVKQYGWDSEGLKGIGYHEWKLFFEGKQTRQEVEQRILKDSLSLAKRQTTWFKRNKSIHWFSTPVNYTKVEELITTYLNKNISN